MTRPALTWLALWLGIATAVAAGIIAGFLSACQNASGSCISYAGDPLWTRRLIDLAASDFARLAPLSQGLIQVEVIP